MKRLSPLQNLRKKFRSYLSFLIDYAKSVMFTGSKPAYCPVVIRITPPPGRRDSY